MPTLALRSMMWAIVFGVAFSVPTVAQTSTPTTTVIETVPDLTMADAVKRSVGAVSGAGSISAGEALTMATRLAVATAPLGASSGGFLIKFDPTTGLQVRTATTFGPTFAERALTTGEGSVSIGVMYMSSKYGRLGSGAIDGLTLQSVTAATPRDSRLGTSNLTITANTVVVGAWMGITDKLDVGATLPIVTVKVGGSTSLVDGDRRGLVSAVANGTSTGLGDIAGLAKYRFFSFGTGQPDPGGLAVMVSMRLPTGDQANLRGLDVTRTNVSLIASSGKGRFRPHGNVGVEAWSKSVRASGLTAVTSVEARHQFQYAAGFELEASPKTTVIADLLGSRILGAGKVGYSAVSAPTLPRYLITLPEGLTRLLVVPGVKLNLKGTMLLSANALIAVKDDGLHARVTPVVGLDFSF